MKSSMASFAPKWSGSQRRTWEINAPVYLGQWRTPEKSLQAIGNVPNVMPNAPLIATRPGIEPTTSWSQVRRPNVTPPSHPQCSGGGELPHLYWTIERELKSEVCCTISCCFFFSLSIINRFFQSGTFLHRSCSSFLAFSSRWNNSQPQQNGVTP